MAGVSWWIVGVTCGVVGVIVIVVGQPAPPPLAGGHCGGPFVGMPHAKTWHEWTTVGHAPSGHVCWMCVGHCPGLTVGHAPSGHVCTLCVGQTVAGPVGGGGHCAGLTVGQAPSGHV
jgi:hypothetical protein